MFNTANYNSRPYNTFFSFFLAVSPQIAVPVILGQMDKLAVVDLATPDNIVVL